MSLPLPVVGRVRALGTAPTRPVPGLIVAAWAALFLNVLGWSDSTTLLPIRHLEGQIIAQAALPTALLLALLANRRLLVRPQLFVLLLLTMAVLSVASSLHSVYVIGSTYRAARFVGFASVLWLLTPWFGRRDLMLLRTHLAVMRGVLAVVIVGLVLSPGQAFSFEGRLSGTLWPIPPTQVAHYSAMLLGITVVLWLCHVIPGRTVLWTMAVAGPLLILTHTRTALLSCVVGIVLGAGSLFLGQARVRRATAVALSVGVMVGTVFAEGLTRWLMRGQSAQQAGQLTGRTKVWSQIAALHRDPLHEIFGNGLSNMSFNGLPIDSSWMSTYVDEGWAGITLQVLVLALLAGLALMHQRGPRRAVALFIVTYCAVASITETGLGAPSPYLLDLTVAATLLTTPLPLRTRPLGRRTP